METFLPRRDFFTLQETTTLGVVLKLEHVLCHQQLKEELSRERRPHSCYSPFPRGCSLRFLDGAIQVGPGSVLADSLTIWGHLTRAQVWKGPRCVTFGYCLHPSPRPGGHQGRKQTLPQMALIGTSAGSGLVEAKDRVAWSTGCRWPLEGPGSGTGVPGCRMDRRNKQNTISREAGGKMLQQVPT